MAIRTGTKVLVTEVQGLVTTQYTGTVTAIYGKSYPRNYEVQTADGGTRSIVEWKCERVK